MQEVITVKQLSKKYGRKMVLDNLNFSVEPGEVVGLIGANGAGKTTLISMLLGLGPCSSGNIQIFGQAPQAQTVKGQIGVMFQDNLVMKRVHAKELLELVQSLYPHALSMQQLEQIAGLGSDLQNYVDKLSGGQLRKLNFALALAGDPQVLFLDEPTAGMDTASRHHFWQYVQRLTTEGKTIIVTSHYLAEIEDVATRILFLKDHHLIHDGSLAALQRDFSQNTVDFETDLEPQELQMTKGQLVVHQNNHYRFVVADVDRFLQELAPQMAQIHDLQIQQTTLDDIFDQINEE